MIYTLREKRALILIFFAIIGLMVFYRNTALLSASNVMLVVLVYALLCLLVGGMGRIGKHIEVRYRDQEALIGVYNSLDIEMPLPRLGGFALSPQHAAKMVGIYLSRKPELIVEFGSGVSTLLAAYCVKKNGHGKVISYENDELHAEVTKNNLIMHNVEKYVDVIVAPLEKLNVDGKERLWYKKPELAEDTRIDIVFVDGPPRRTNNLARYPALPIMKPFLQKDSLVILDDAARKDEKAIASIWLEENSELSLIRSYDLPNLAVFHYKG